MKSKEIIKDSLIYPFLDLKKTFTMFILFLTSFLIFPAIMAFNFKKIFNLIKKVGIKKYTMLVVIFTLVAEFINEAPVEIMKIFIGFSGIWASIGFILFSLLIITYLLISASRFTGLIYPESKENNEK
jgi:prolipoprotein diacylglyceryltransferase